MDLMLHIENTYSILTALLAGTRRRLYYKRRTLYKSYKLSIVVDHTQHLALLSPKIEEDPHTHACNAKES